MALQVERASPPSSFNSSVHSIVQWLSGKGRSPDCRAGRLAAKSKLSGDDTTSDQDGDLASDG